MPGYDPLPEQHFDWIEEKGGSVRIARFKGNGVIMSIVQMKEGAEVPAHSHSLGSYMYVTSGALEVDGHLLSAGDAGKCQPGYGHYPVKTVQDSTYVVCRDIEDEMT